MEKLLLVLLLIISTLHLNAQTLTNIEAVEYDASQNRFFISNGNSIIARASNGDLSFFGSNGATNGMEVLGDHLFVIDGSTIRGFELVSENEIMTLNITGSLFLNGLTTDGDSTLFATDFSARKIYKINVADINNPSFEVIVDNTSTTPNGIVYDDVSYRLIFVNWSTNAAIKAVNLMDNSVSTIITTSFGNIDGIDEDNDDNYYISTWNPSQIVKYDKDFANAPEIVTTPFLNNPADICYAKEIDTLAIPHYPGGGNQVAFVGFGTDTMTTSYIDIFSNDFNLEIYPNPVIESSVIQFQLKEKTLLNLSVYNQEGKLLKTLLDGEQNIGNHTISFLNSNLPSGNHWLVMETQKSKKSIQIQVP